MNDSTSTLFPVLNLAKVKKQTETDRRLPSWLSMPTQFPAVNLVETSQDIDEFHQYIDEDLRRYLKKNMLIGNMFPVQKCLIPNLSMQFRSRPYRRPNDICVSSPTGSGKTLAYAIPIVNHLKQSLTRSFRALVMLPSRDLAIQVHKTFEQICTPTILRCALAVGDGPDALKGFFRKLPRKDENGNEMEDDDENLGSRQCSILNNHYHEFNHGEQYSSAIDILVSTPGVLIDLMHNSPGFSLQDLEILVLDEADRLMTNHKHDWLNAIERSIFSNLPECPCRDESSMMKSRGFQQVAKKRRVCYSSTTACVIQHCHESKPLHKLLFSATLSSDPQILMHMNLFQPRLFLATKPTITSTKIRNSLGTPLSTPISSPAPQHKATVNTRSELLTSSAIPDQLEEKMFITEAKEKLFVLWYLLHELKYKNVICFTNQLQTSSRLCKFLNEVDGVRAVEFSSNLKPETRQKYLNEFKKDRVEVIVCTDLMARGMDVEGVDHVISYDMPASEIFYVHRVGRTARAGKKGSAITLVDTKQLVQFKKIVQLAHKMPNSMRLSDVVEEMKVPHSVKKDAEKYDLYTKTLENYEDKLNSFNKKNKFMRRPK